MKRRFAPTALLALALSAGALSAQADDLAGVRAELGEVHAARIAAAIEAGEREGLPRSLLVDKAVEGAAKGMNPEIVLEAVRVLAEELRAARVVVGPDAEPGTLAKTADALRHGVDRDLLVELQQRNPVEYPVLVVAIEDLLHAGVRLEVAESIIREAAARGLRGEEVLVLPATVRRLVREGSSPGQAASSVQARLRMGPPIPPFSSARPGGPLGSARPGPLGAGPPGPARPGPPSSGRAGPPFEAC